MIDKIRAMCETDPERSLTYVGGASLAIDGPYVVWPILRLIEKSFFSFTLLLLVFYGRST